MVHVLLEMDSQQAIMTTAAEHQYAGRLYESYVKKFNNGDDLFYFNEYGLYRAF